MTPEQLSNKRKTHFGKGKALLDKQPIKILVF